MEHQILSKTQIYQKIKRIAFEVYERNFKETEVVLAGIDPMGYVFAELLQKELTAISPLKIRLIRVKVDKSAQIQCPIAIDCAIEELQNKVVILMDDVLNTGRTLMYAMKPFLETGIKKLQVAVVVDRNQKTFPVYADYIGYSLATTLLEHVEVILEGERFGAYIK